jgi:hypothetical protein
MSGGHFPIEISARPGKLLTIRELRVVAEVTLFLKVSNLQTKLLRVGKNLCENIVPPNGLFCQQHLAKFC